MIEFLTLFKWTLIGTTLSAATLAWMGAHLTARNQGLQTLVVTQSSSLGVLLALFLTGVLELKHSHFVSEVGFALIVSAVIYWGSETWLGRKQEKRENFYLALYALLIAGSYILISQSSHLDAHSHNSFFGDVALSSDSDSLTLIFLSLISAGILIKGHRSFTLATFTRSLSSQSGSLALQNPWYNRIFQVLSLVWIVLSVKSFGTLFTVSALFIPGLVLSGFAKSLKNFEALLVISALLGNALGFLGSYWFPTLPTSALISVCFVFMAGILGLANQSG